MYIEPCPWYTVPDSNLLCCWAWSSLQSYPGTRYDPAQRLNLLFALGLNVNNKAYPNGTVMHALFEQPNGHVHKPLPLWYPELHLNPTYPFEYTKFELINRAGYDFTDGTKYGSVLNRAKKLHSTICHSIERGVYDAHFEMIETKLPHLFCLFVHESKTQSERLYLLCFHCCYIKLYPHYYHVYYELDRGDI